MFNFKVANVLKSVLFLVLFLIFFKLNLLSKFNILIFLVIIIWDLVCVMLYLCLYTYIQHDSENWFLMYSIRHNKDLFKKISVILMRINLYCNPFIVLISAIEVLFYKQFKKLNY